MAKEEKDWASHFAKKVNPEMIEAMRELREGGMVLRKIADKMGVSYETVRSHLKKKHPVLYDYSITRHVRNKKPPKAKHFVNVKYDFLKNHRIVFIWARETSGLSNGIIEMLLWLYPIGVFSKKEFREIARTFTIMTNVPLNTMLDGGWVVPWTKEVGRGKKVLTLSNKARLLCGDLHAMLAGEKDIPVKESRNGIMKGNPSETKDYLMNMIKQINKDRK